MDGAPMHLSGEFTHSPLAANSPGRIMVPISVTSGQASMSNIGTSNICMSYSAGSNIEACPIGTPIPQTPLVTYKTYWLDQNSYRKVVEDRFQKLETELNRLRSETIYLRDQNDKQRSFIAQQFNIN
jgi:hypothetical protein